MGWISSNIISDLGGAIESHFDPHVSDLGGVVHTPGQPNDDDTRSGSQQATVDHHVGMRAPTIGERLENWWTQPAHKYAGVLGIPEESPQQKAHDVEKAAMVGGLATTAPIAPVEAAAATLGGTILGYGGGKLGHYVGGKVGAPELGQDIGELTGGIIGGKAGADIGGEAAGIARNAIHERAAVARANMAARANAAEANTIDLTPDQYRWVPDKAKGGFKALSPSGATVDLKTAAPPPTVKVDVSAEGPSWERQLAARKNGTVVGGVGYKIDPQGKAQIYGSVVTPEHRGKGIGQQMYENAAYDAKSQGATKLVSDATNTSPDAIRVWQKMQAKGWPITPITHPNGKPGFEMDLSQVHFKANPEPAPITFGEDSLGRYATSSDSPAKVYIPKNLEGDDVLKYAENKLELQRNFAANRAAKPVVRNPGVSEVAQGATEYNATQNRPPVVAANEHANPEFGARTADAYEAMRHEPENPKVQRSYNALKNDIQNQWNFATQNMGIKFEPWTGEGQPYRDSGDMERDVRENHHLYFYRGGEMPGDHPLADVDPNTGLRYNDMLRAVHDLFGHAAHGNQFGPTGERNAYLDHAQMFSHEALPALTSETHGQNSWVNFGSHLRNAEGIVPKKGETGYIAPTERPFAQQKAGLLPKRFQSPATYHPDLQAVADKYGVTNRADQALNAKASFIAPDGKFIPLNGTTHPEAIEKLTGERSEEDREALGEKMSGNTNPTTDSRVRFLGETGAIRVRASNDRAGKTLHISVPPDGITEEQTDALKRLVAQQGRHGNLVIERSDVTPETKDQLSQYREFASPSNVDEMLRQIGAHPEGAIEPQSTDLKNVPLLQIPSDLLGEGMGTTESTIGHEYGHVLEGALRETGEPSTTPGESGIMSHNHPRMEGHNAVGGVQLGFSQKALQDAFGVPRHTFLNTRASNGMPYYRNILDRFIAGGMVEQEYYNIPWEKNNGTSDDIKKAVDVLVAAGIDDPKQMRDEIAASQERIKHDLTIPGMRDIFRQYAESREEGLAPEYHASLEKLQDFIAKVKQHYEIQKGPQTLASRGGISQTGTTAPTGEAAGGNRRGTSGLANRGETGTAGEGEQGEGTTGYQKFLNNVGTRLVQENAGQNILDDMEEHNISPRDVSKKFWNETYFQLPAESQNKFTRYIKRLTGFEPGDHIGVTADKTPIIAEDWLHIVNEILDLPETVEHLEGAERGLVAGMKAANDAADANKNEQLSLDLKKKATISDPMKLWENYKDAFPFVAHRDGFFDTEENHEAAYAVHKYGPDAIPTDYESLASSYGEPEHVKGWAAKNGSMLFFWDNLTDVLEEKKPIKYPALQVAIKQLKSNGMKSQTKIYDEGGNRYLGTAEDLGWFNKSPDFKKRTNWADKAVNLTNDSSAGAIDPNTGKVDKTGFGVEVYPEARAGNKPLDHPPTAQDFQKFYEDNKEVFDKHPELRVGWDKTDKGWELNIGASGTEAGARLVGRNLDQRAAYDIENQKVIPTGGKGEKTKFAGYPLEERLADLTGESVKKLPAEISKSPHLTDDEKYLLASEPSALKDFKETRKKIAPTEEIAATALTGTANRHWYARARSSFNAMFDSLPQDFHTESDREKFPALVAATSPQSDPALNLRKALDAYKKWVDAGRPTDVNEVRKIVDPVLELGAHRANAARAVTGQELSGPKVSSFSKNFAGHTENVTNDMWGAITNDILDASELSKPGKYIALSENYRKAAEWLNKNGKTGEFGKPWTPEEAQAASWGFIRTLGYASGWKGTGSWKPPELVVRLVDDPLVRKFSADIADIMLTDDEVRDRLESLGVNLEDFDAQLEQGIKQFGRGKKEGKTEGVDVKHLASSAQRVERAKQYAVTQAKTGARVAGKMQPLVNQILSGDFKLTPDFKLKRKK